MIGLPPIVAFVFRVPRLVATISVLPLLDGLGNYSGTRITSVSPSIVACTSGPQHCQDISQGPRLERQRDIRSASATKDEPHAIWPSASLFQFARIGKLAAIAEGDDPATRALDAAAIGCERQIIAAGDCQKIGLPGYGSWSFCALALFAATSIVQSCDQKNATGSRASPM